MPKPSSWLVNTLENTKKQLWDIFCESPLSNFGIGGTQFKNPVLYRLLIKIDDAIGDAENKFVLDVGCGCGVKSLLLALKGAKVNGFDVSPNAIYNCLENLKKIKKPVDAKFFVWDIQKGFPIERDENVDFILCTQVIEHIPNYEKALNEMIHVLKPGGKIFITTPNKLTHEPKRGEKVFGEKLHHHYHSFSKDDLKKVVERRRDIRIEELSTYNIKPPFTIAILLKILGYVDSFQRLTQKIDEKAGTGMLETLYVNITKPLVMVYNAFVYPSILDFYLKNEEKIEEDKKLTIYLILKKLAN